MTFLTTTKDGAKDSATRNIDIGAVDVSPLVKKCTCVTHASAEEVTSDWVCGNAFQSARHTQGATAHRDGAIAHNVGDFVAAIYGGKDMATYDFHTSVTIHATSRSPPNARPDGIIARTATKHITEE